MPPAPWSKTEVTLIVNDYFSMLSKELSGKSYNKTDHRNALALLLKNRSKGSIEFKHQNISAVLISFGLPYIKGYLPRFNFQKILTEAVKERFIENKEIENDFLQFSDSSLTIKHLVLNWKKFLVEPPLDTFREPQLKYQKTISKINYLEREQNNINVGKQGEQIVFDYEKWYLQSINKEKLADKVEWISQTHGDGEGFDILSKYSDGKDKFIEVKSTKLGKESPFYFSRNELDFSLKNKNNFFLYRVFNIKENPGMFIKNGDLQSICKSVPVSYQGFF